MYSFDLCIRRREFGFWKCSKFWNFWGCIWILHCHCASATTSTCTSSSVLLVCTSESKQSKSFLCKQIANVVTRQGPWSRVGIFQNVFSKPGPKNFVFNFLLISATQSENGPAAPDNTIISVSLSLFVTMFDDHVWKYCYYFHCYHHSCLLIVHIFMIGMYHIGMYLCTMPDTPTFN